MEKPLFTVIGRSVEFWPDPSKAQLDPEEAKNYKYTIGRLPLDLARSTATLMAEIFITAHVANKTFLVGDFVEEMTAEQGNTIGNMLISLLTAFPAEADKIYNFIGEQILDPDGNHPTAADMKDGNKWPAASLWTLMDALDEHPDTEDFFSGAKRWQQRVMKKHPQAAAFAKNLSKIWGGVQSGLEKMSGGNETLTSSGVATESETTTSAKVPAAEMPEENGSE